jgi:hypothetical protein
MFHFQFKQLSVLILVLPERLFGKIRSFQDLIYQLNCFALADRGNLDPPVFQRVDIEIDFTCAGID